jgi:hypothetical protein
MRRGILQLVSIKNCTHFIRKLKQVRTHFMYNFAWFFSVGVVDNYIR